VEDKEESLEKRLDILFEAGKISYQDLINLKVQAKKELNQDADLRSMKDYTRIKENILQLLNSEDLMYVESMLVINMAFMETMIQVINYNLDEDENSDDEGEGDVLKPNN